MRNIWYFATIFQQGVCCLISNRRLERLMSECDTPSVTPNTRMCTNSASTWLVNYSREYAAHVPISARRYQAVSYVDKKHIGKQCKALFAFHCHSQGNYVTDSHSCSAYQMRSKKACSMLTSNAHAHIHTDMSYILICVCVVTPGNMNYFPPL